MLKDFLISDLATYFDANDFADTATFSHAGGATTNISVIFDNDYLASLGVETSAPIALCKSSDVESAAHNDTLTISGTVYRITGIHPDGSGITTLILSRDAV